MTTMVMMMMLSIIRIVISGKDEEGGDSDDDDEEGDDDDDVDDDDDDNDDDDAAYKAREGVEVVVLALYKAVHYEPVIKIQHHHHHSSDQDDEADHNDDPPPLGLVRCHKVWWRGEGGGGRHWSGLSQNLNTREWLMISGLKHLIIVFGFSS